MCLICYNCNSWPFVLTSVVIVILGLFILFRAWHVTPPEGLVYKVQTWLTSGVEVYVGVVSTLQALAGLALMVLVLMVVAFGPLGSQVAFTDLFMDFFTGQLVVILWPFGMGAFIFFTGLIGVRMARTRDCCWITIYLIGGIACLYRQYRLFEYLGLLQSAPLGILDSNLWNTVDSTGLSDRDRTGSSRRTFYKTFVGFMGKEMFDCQLMDPELGSCAAKVQEQTAIFQCNQPYPASRAFQQLVNNHCVAGMNVSRCARCVENFGVAAGIEDWNPADPANRVFCKCASNFYDSATGWIESLGGVSEACLILEGLLLLCVLYLAFIAPSKSELLTRRVHGARRMLNEKMNRMSREENRTTAGQCIQLVGLLMFLVSIPLFIISIGIVTKPTASVLSPEVSVMLFVPGVLVLTLAFCACHINSDQFPTDYVFTCCMLLIFLPTAALALLNLGGPEQLHLAKYTGIPNITSMVLEHAVARETGVSSFTSLFDRRNFDCVVEDAGESCNETGGIKCRQATAELFEYFINRNCIASQSCDRCVQANEMNKVANVLDQENVEKSRERVWCKCVGALEVTRMSYWTWLLYAAALQGLIVGMMVTHMCLGAGKCAWCRSSQDVEGEGLANWSAESFTRPEPQTGVQLT